MNEAEVRQISSISAVTPSNSKAYAAGESPCMEQP